jgi:xylulokinase
MQPLLVGVDVGTTNIKAAVFDQTGREIAFAKAKTPTRYPHPGWAYYEPDEIWQNVLEVIRSVVSKIENPQRIVSIACASMGEAGVVLDKAGNPIFPIIAWFDQRARAQATQLASRIGAEVIMRITGLDINPIFSLCKIMWIRDNQNDLYIKASKWLNIADYISYKLCGVMATDYSLASRTLMFNLNELRWSSEILNEVDTDINLLANLVPSGTQLGFILPEVAQVTGLPPTTIVSAGGHDHVCAALALGVVSQGTILDSLGSAEALFVPIEQVVIEPDLCRKGYAHGTHVAGGYYVMAGLFASGIAVEWFRESIAQGTSLEELIEEATHVSAGSLGAMFLPHLRTANTPHNDPLSLGAFIGLTTDIHRGALFRAVLEGIALEIYHALDVLSEKYSVNDLKIIAAGGGVKNNLLMNIKANVFGRPIIAKSIEEATTLGAALLGGVGAGVYTNAKEAALSICSESRVIEPDEKLMRIYADLYNEIYKYLYISLRALNHKIILLLK